MKQIIGFAAIALIGIWIGGHLAAHIFFGILMLVGLIALVENIPFVKWLVYKSNNFIDILLFVLSILATIYVGVTITAAITVAGLGYTMGYAPYVRRQIAKRKAAQKNQNLFY